MLVDQSQKDTYIFVRKQYTYILSLSVMVAVTYWGFIAVDPKLLFGESDILERHPYHMFFVHGGNTLLLMLEFYILEIVEYARFNQRHL